MSKHDDLGPLPANIESEARMCLDLLVKHLDNDLKSDKLRTIIKLHLTKVLVK